MTMSNTGRTKAKLISGGYFRDGKMYNPGDTVYLTDFQLETMASQIEVIQERKQEGSNRKSKG